MMNQPLLVAGVGTHKDTHYTAVITATGAHIGPAEFPATDAGYRALTGFIICHGVLLRTGVEGTNSYGAGLTRPLHNVGIEVVEVIRPALQIRQPRRLHRRAHRPGEQRHRHREDQQRHCRSDPNHQRCPPQRPEGTHRGDRATQVPDWDRPEPLRDEYRNLATGALVPKLSGSRGRAGDDEMEAHPETRDYVTRRTAEGKTKKDILRGLKRASAREVFHLITDPQPSADTSDLRPTRRALDLTLAKAADALYCSLLKIYRIERGHVGDSKFVSTYRTWLNEQTTAQLAA